MLRLLALAALAALPAVAIAAPPTAVPGPGEPSPVTYNVPQPAGHARLSEGWGLFATLSGRSTDLGAHDFQWSDDPSVQAHDVEAGYGWRRGGATAVIGYEEHDYGPKVATTAQERQDRDVHRFGDSGVLGLSLVLHGH